MMKNKKMNEETVMLCISVVSRVIEEVAPPGSGRKELILIGHRALAKSLKHHNAKRGKLSWYAYNQVNDAMCRYLRQEKTGEM